MMSKFPKYIKNNQIAERGVTLVKQIVENDLKWIFRPNSLEHDFGIDGYIDIVNDDNAVTGKYLGVQIKTGKSYFKSRKKNGWNFHGETKHLNYYSNLDYPVIIILVDIDTKKAYWTKFDIENVTKAKNGWKLMIRENQELNQQSIKQLKLLTGREIDYLPQIEYQWAIDKEIKNSGLVMLAVSREEIEQLNFSGFEILLKRITSNEDSIEECRGKISFAIFGYDDDERELYEIEEVRKWVKLVIPIFKYWGYFLHMDEEVSKFAGLRILQYCSTDSKIVKRDKEKGRVKVFVDNEKTIELMTELFGWLNEFTELHKINLEINKKQSKKIARILLNL